MRQLCVAAVLSSGLVVANAFADDLEDYTVTTAGTMTFESPVSYGKLQNAVSSGAVVFDQSAYEKTEAYANSFTNFDAVANASTTFLGGWWDFAGGDFFSAAATLSGRMTTIDGGAIVTNVANVNLAGTGGTDNGLYVKGASTFAMGRFVFGSLANTQRSVCRVTEGSRFLCSGDVSMSESGSWAAYAKNLTGNEFEVAGEGSRLEIKGTFSLGRDLGGNYSGTGGNTFTLDDGATAEIGALQVAMGVRHGPGNKLTFGKNTRTTLGSFRIGNSTTINHAGSNVVSIVDGAVVTNNGTFAFGGDGKQPYNELLVSNAVFSTQKGNVVNDASYLFYGPKSTITVSGPDAVFSVREGVHAFFRGDGCTFIVENGAYYRYGNTTFANTVDCNDETLWVRNGSTVETAGNLTLSQTGKNHTCRNNAVVVENGSTLTVGGQLHISDKNGRLVVDDSTVTMPYMFLVGASETGSIVGTNGLVVLRGSCPYVYSGYGAKFANSSLLRIDLPPDGYDEGSATTDRPLMRCGVATSGGMSFLDDSTLEITGAEEFLKFHERTHRKGSYVLLSGHGAGKLLLSEEKLAAVQATLPEGLTVSLRDRTYDRDLLLTAKPKFGLMLLVR